MLSIENVSQEDKQIEENKKILSQADEPLDNGMDLPQPSNEEIQTRPMIQEAWKHYACSESGERWLANEKDAKRMGLDPNASQYGSDPWSASISGP